MRRARFAAIAVSGSVIALGATQPAAGAVTPIGVGRGLGPTSTAQADPAPSGGSSGTAGPDGTFTNSAWHRGRHRSATALVSVDGPVTDEQAAAIQALHGVTAVERAGLATLTIDGHHARALGVNPDSFRAYTPKLTARSNGLWQNVSDGDVTVSFEMGKGAKLPLGGQVPVTEGSRKRSLRVGAFATIGISGVDAFVSRSAARALGMPNGNALLVTAPHVTSHKLRDKLRHILGDKADVHLLHVAKTARVRHDSGTGSGTGTGDGSGLGADGGTVPGASTGAVSSKRIQVAIKAAESKLGDPYVWGAEGPNTFDCSGLVQWAYGQAGLSLPRVTDQQFLIGEHIPYSQARPGDLLFWRNDPTAPHYVSHVAIYLGDDYMIEAPHTGDVVKIIRVPRGSTFAGTVRIQVRH